MGRIFSQAERVSALLVVVLGIALLSGCQSALDPGAFEKFTESTVMLRDGAEEAL